MLSGWLTPAYDDTNISFLPPDPLDVHQPNETYNLKQMTRNSTRIPTRVNALEEQKSHLNLGNISYLHSSVEGHSSWCSGTRGIIPIIKTSIIIKLICHTAGTSDAASVVLSEPRLNKRLLAEELLEVQE